MTDEVQLGHTEFTLRPIDEKAIFGEAMKELAQMLDVVFCVMT